MATETKSSSSPSSKATMDVDMANGADAPGELNPNNKSAAAANATRPPPTIYQVNEPPNEAPIPFADDYAKFKGNGDISIVIDNGANSFRAGWSTDESPRMSVPPWLSRVRDRKAGRTYTLIGQDAFADTNSRSQAKHAFDSNIVANYDVMEGLLDFCFLKLGIDDEEGINHPVVMTEAVCNPNYCRKTMTETLFEAYRAPSLTYGIDSLFAYHYNGGTDGLVISSSHTATHVIPVLNGKGLIPLATRLNWGGALSAEFLYKLLGLKYQTFPTRITGSQVEEILKEHCYVSGDYREEVKAYLQPDELEKKDRVLQFPFTETVVVQKTEEELARIAERRKESGRRLQEQAQKMRLQRLKKKEQELEYYKEMLERGKTASKKEFQRDLESDGFRDEAQLEKVIKELEKAIRRSRNKDIGIEEEEEEEKPTFPLLEIPDDQLDEEQLKQKKTQKLMKANYEARQRAKAEKEKERERIREIERKDEEFRTNDLEGWIKEKRGLREGLLAKLKERQRIKAALSDRKSAASQSRMKHIAHLASDEPTRKRRRGNEEDNFGANDDDWGIYREIAVGGNEEEEEEEEEMNNELKNLEAALLKHDPDFEEHHTHEASQDWSKSLVHAFLRGTRPFDEENQAEANQMHLNIERIRVPEVIFEPTMAGVEQAGIVEIASNILLQRLTNPDDRERALRDIFLTGGNTLFKGFEDRLRAELRAVLPFELPMKLRSSKDPIMDAWKGAAKWAADGTGAEFKEAMVTREEYLEKGSDYLKEHRFGNVFS